MLDFFEKKLAELSEIQQKRQLPTPFDYCFGKYIYYNNTPYTNFSTNDYLGFSQHRKIIDQLSSSLSKREDKQNPQSPQHPIYSIGNCSSRLISGNAEIFSKLESKISHWRDMESALIFNSGYQANIGVLPTLKTHSSETIYFFDKLAHASLIDGIMLSQCKWVSFKHNDSEDLEKKIKKYSDFSQKIIVTEAVFSMNGDIAPLKKILTIANQYQALLYVDEAHAIGVFGNEGEGFSKIFEFDRYPNVISMGTMGKALGSFGAFVCAKKVIKEYLVNFARSFVFATALPTPVLKATLSAIELLENEKEYANNQCGEKILNLAKYTQEQFKKNNIPHLLSDSHILAILTKDNKTTNELSNWLYEKKIFAIGIRPPTVPRNQGRIRLVINAFLEKEDIDYLIISLNGFFENQL